MLCFRGLGLALRSRRLRTTRFVVPHALWLYFFFFFFNDTATTEIYTLSLHDALPISERARRPADFCCAACRRRDRDRAGRSEEHTSELQSRVDLVCRLLLEKKKEKAIYKSSN